MDRVLRIGTKGDDVKDLQFKLKALGFDPGPVDGHFGEKTKFAVQAFQVNKSLLADGIVGPQTAMALGDKIEEPSATRPAPVYKTLAQIDAHFEKGTAAWYQAAYLICEYDAGTEKRVTAAANRVLAQKSLYLELERLRGIPWVMTGLIHSLECNNNPRGVLHNGELIVGTSKKTTIVPRGRGPFKTWIAAALDAVDSEAIWKVPNWSVGNILKQCERFNGTGVLRYHHSENTAYLWACTNINDGTGKYVSDGVWSETANANTQEGCAAILKYLEDHGHAKVLYQ